MTLPKLGIIILAAGAGRRMGRTKQLLPFGRTTLLGQAMETARQAGPAARVLVLGHKAGDIRGCLDCTGFEVVENPEWETGQASSLKAGVKALPGQCSGALFMLGDQPLVRPDTIVALQKRFQRLWQPGKRIIIPRYRRRRGNPVVIGRDLFPHIMALSGDTGARVLFDEFRDYVVMQDVDDPGVGMDADTWEEYQALVKAAGGANEKSPPGHSAREGLQP